MNNGSAPEFRGKFPSLTRPEGPGASQAQFFTREVFFLSALALGVFTIQSIFSPLRAEVPPRFAPLNGIECAVPFALPGLDGRRHALAAQSGRPVLVHFFATWCEPCKAELATLQQFFARRGDEVRVLAVNVGEVPSRVRRFLDAAPVGFPVVLDEDRAVTKSWAIEGLPSTVLLNSNLTPKLAVTGDLDWTDAAVGREIDTVLTATPDSKPANCTREDTR